MDFPVEATVHLNQFTNKRQARNILHSHGLQLEDLGDSRFHVEGFFSQLKAAKLQLEQLVQNQPGSSGTVSSYYDDAGSRRSQPREQRDSPAAATAPAGGREQEASSHSLQRSLTRPRQEMFIIDSDVFKYAGQFRKKEMDDILTCHSVSMTAQESGDSSTVVVRGQNSNTAAHKLQRLLDQLGKSLRTQEVPRRDMDREGDALLDRIRQDRNIYKLVLVRETKDGLHLVGPPKESFELQQQLMGNSAGSSGQGYDRGSRLRSSSLPTSIHKNKRPRATDNSPPVGGAAGYTPPGNPDDRTEPEREARGLQRLSSFKWGGRSNAPQKKKVDKPSGVSPGRRDTTQNPTSPVFKFFNIFRTKKHKK